MQDIFQIHPDYSNFEITQQAISIALRQDGFSFVIHNLENEKIIGVFYKTFSDTLSRESYLQELELFLNHELVQQQFKSFSILYVTPKITIIPSAIFKTDEIELLYTCNYKLEDFEKIQTYKIKNSESHLVFAISNEILECCKSKIHQNFNIFPQAAPFIESSILQNKLLNERNIFISLESSFFDILVLDGPKILLYNTFEFSNVNDYIFYVMNIFEQLQLNPLQNKVVLSGKISQSSNYFESTKMFIKHVTTIEPFASQNELFHYPFNKVSYPLFSHLCNLSLCE